MKRNANPALLALVFLVIAFPGSYWLGPFAHGQSKDELNKQRIERATGPRSVRRLAESVRLPSMRVSLDPVPARVHPAIDGNQAISRAWKESPLPGIDSTEAQLVLFTNTQFPDPFVKDPIKVPAWVVRFEGVCLPSHGPVGHKPQSNCFFTHQNVVINATTGRFIMAYSLK